MYPKSTINYDSNSCPFGFEFLLCGEDNEKLFQLDFSHHHGVFSLDKVRQSSLNTSRYCANREYSLHPSCTSAMDGIWWELRADISQEAFEIVLMSFISLRMKVEFEETKQPAQGPTGRKGWAKIPTHIYRSLDCCSFHRVGGGHMS